MIEISFEARSRAGKHSHTGNRETPCGTKGRGEKQFVILRKRKRPCA